MKTESVRRITKFYTSFDDHGMTWPTPGPDMGELEWTLRYSHPSRIDLLKAASVVAAYSQLVKGNDSTRRLIARGLKQAMKLEVK